MAWEDLKASISANIKTNDNQEIDATVLLTELFRMIDVIGDENFLALIKHITDPSRFASYLAEANAPFTTDSLVANTPTKIKIPTTIKYATDFEVVSDGNGSYTIEYTGADDIRIAAISSVSFTGSVNNVLVSSYVYKNGVKEEDLGITQKIGTGGDYIATISSGEIGLSQGDHVDMYVEVSAACTLSVTRFNTIFYVI